MTHQQRELRIASKDCSMSALERILVAIQSFTVELLKLMPETRQCESDFTTYELMCL